MAPSPQKQAAAAQQKRDREKARNRSSVSKKSQLRRATKQYKKTEADLQAQIILFDEVIRYSQERILDFNTRISLLNAEYGSLEATSQYFKEAFSSLPEGSRYKILQKEAEADFLTVGRDVQTAVVRRSYYIERQQIAKNSKEDAQAAIDEAKNKYTQLLGGLQIAPAAVHEKKTKGGGGKSGSPLPPSSEPEEEYINIFLPRRAPGRINDDIMDAQLDSDGQYPIPQASTDSEREEED